jgi:hypothetical protein
VIYFAAIVLGVGIVVVSVAKQLRGPARRGPPAPPPTRAALRLCLADLEDLFREQNQRAWRLAADLERPAPFRTWQDWAQDWAARLDDLSDRCGLDADDPKQDGYAERSELAASRDALKALHRAYGQHVARFAADHGELVQAAAESLAHARIAVSRPR